MKDITEAVTTSNCIAFYWALKRHPPCVARAALNTLDPDTLVRFMHTLAGEWYRLRAQIEAVNDALDVGGALDL
jgi:hypothetical protein